MWWSAHDLCSHRYIRDLLIIRSANNAVAISLPVLASVLSFVVYALSGHKLDAANIFASLTLFQLLRLPLMFLRASCLRFPFLRLLTAL